MKILHSIWSLAFENGGPTRSTIGYVLSLAKAGSDVVLVSHQPRTLSEDVVEKLKSEGVSYYEGSGFSYKIALEDSRRILEKEKPDIVHIQGMWKMSNHAMNVAAKERGIKIVISPHGMLDPWALSVKRVKKLIGMLLYQKRDLVRAAAFHVMCKNEADHVREFGLKAPIIEVPIGVDIPKDMTPCQNKVHKTALFLSRLHPGKGLMLLAEAWAKLRPADWRMLVVGPDKKGHQAEVQERIRQLGIEGSWEFYGPVDDAGKWAIYNSADLFIHPSASENFCLSIAEALASGLPVITTKGCPWSEIEGTCGWWIERTVDNLIEAMRSAMSLSDEERRSMGIVGHNLISDKYSWSAVAKKMIEGYEAVLCR